jgi:hypothetical protein
MGKQGRVSTKTLPLFEKLYISGMLGGIEMAKVTY